MKKIVATLILFFPIIAIGQNYSYSLIADSLKQNADAVKRYEKLHVQIKSPSKAVVKHKWAITILNQAGDEFSGYYSSYDKMKPLTEASGRLYDANGKEIKSIRKKEMEDISEHDGMSLALDDRVKKHNFYYRNYPYTIEYEEEQEYNTIFFLPAWHPVEGDNFSVEQSTFIVEAPADYTFRYKQNNYPGKPEIKNGSYTWTLNNFGAVFYEPFRPSFSDILTTVYIAPSEFELGKYKGDMSSWNGLGKFIATLNEGKDQVPENIKQQVIAIAQKGQTTEEKVKLIYEFMQKSTRYISIQLGIGGWQPFDATYVASKSYGDCKALSNYMVSLLKLVGINANYVLITAGPGRTGLWEDFPSPYFNHAIMCVPGEKDTLWLECTSQTESAGFMGSFTDNRKALLINETGGVVVKTPAYSVTDNLQIRKITASVDAEGNLIAEVKTRFTGQQQEEQHRLIHSYTNEQRQKYLNSQIGLPTYKVEKYDYVEHKGKIPEVEEYLKITSPVYANVSGKRLFIQPNLFNKLATKLSTDKTRKYDIKLSSSYRDIDSIEIILPEGYQPESVPKEMSVQQEWGKYNITFKVSENKIVLVRLHEMYAGTYPAAVYASFVKYLDDIYKADRSKIVLVKKE